MFLVKEHPDPGSKDPEEDYPKFGLVDQVCNWSWREGLQGRGSLARSQGKAVLCQVVLWSTAELLLGLGGALTKPT